MNLFDQIVSHIIRPSRDYYKISKLGPRQLITKSKINNQILHICREDNIIVNQYKKKIHLSLYSITTQSNTPVNSDMCVIYLHANNGSRNEGLAYLKTLLENQLNVVLFDCTGSGISDGEFVTLGLLEAEDLACVIEFLKEKKNIRKIGLWGRSMGAVAALMYASKNPEVLKAGVYDSPFYSLNKLIREVANLKTGLPQFFFKPILPFLEKQIKIKTKVQISQLKLKHKLESIRCAGYLLTSKNDKLVNSEHSEKIYKLYGGEKSINYIQSQHHENRSKEVINNCVQFLKTQLFKQQLMKKTSLKDRKYLSRDSYQSDSENYDNKITEIPNETMQRNKPLIHIPSLQLEPSEKISISYLRRTKVMEATTRENPSYYMQNNSTYFGNEFESPQHHYRSSNLEECSNTRISLFFDESCKGIRRVQIRK